MNTERKWFRWWMVPVVVCILVFLLFHFVLIIGYVPTASMESTLKEGSYLLASRIYPSLEKGDIIVFWHDEKLLVKRIAAVPGDLIAVAVMENVQDGNIDRNRTLAVPEGCYYVLGDNLEKSMDSRYWKEPFVKEREVVGKVMAIK